MRNRAHRLRINGVAHETLKNFNGIVVTKGGKCNSIDYVTICFFLL